MYGGRSEERRRTTDASDEPSRGSTHGFHGSLPRASGLADGSSLRLGNATTRASFRCPLAPLSRVVERCLRVIRSLNVTSDVASNLSHIPSGSRPFDQLGSSTSNPIIPSFLSLILSTNNEHPVRSRTGLRYSRPSQQPSRPGGGGLSSSRPSPLPPPFASLRS